MGLLSAADKERVLLSAALVAGPAGVSLNAPTGPLEKEPKAGDRTGDRGGGDASTPGCPARTPSRPTSSLLISSQRTAEVRSRGNSWSLSLGGGSPAASPHSAESRRGMPGAAHFLDQRAHLTDGRPLSSNSHSTQMHSPGLWPSLASYVEANKQSGQQPNTPSPNPNPSPDHTRRDAHSGDAHTGDSQAKRDAALDAAQIEEVLAYRARYAINPFKKEEGAMFLRTRTHNRRRWSHVFPWGWGDYTKNLPGEMGFTGLNWKSLCQPAILPLTTDYIPQVPDLKNSYSNSSPYQLLLDGKCAFDSPESLLQEMVCQRLSQDFQLVEAESGAGQDAASGPAFNPLPYFEYAMKMDHQADRHTPAPGHTSHSSHAGASPSQPSQHSQQALAPTHPSSATHGSANSRLFYILSMGHRIQFLFYEPSTRNVKVTQLTSNREANPNPNPNTSNREARAVTSTGSTGSMTSYTYELWVPQVCASSLYPNLTLTLTCASPLCICMVFLFFYARFHF